MAVYVADLRSTTGWTERWKTTEGSVSVIADGFRIAKTANTGPYALTWDTIDSDANRDKAEVLTKVRLTSASSSAVMLAGPLVRGAGATGAEDYICAVLYKAGNAGTDRRPYMLESSGGSGSALSAGALVSNATNTWYWIKTRVNGTSAKARAWLDGEAEPSTWTVDVTATLDAVGWCGIYAFDTLCDPYDIGYFAVATNGDSLSTGASGGFFLGADF